MTTTERRAQIRATRIARDKAEPWRPSVGFIIMIVWFVVIPVVMYTLLYLGVLQPAPCDGYSCGGTDTEIPYWD